MIRLRPGQQDVYGYPGGFMGVSAVPGSGKTTALSHLAARLILEDRLRRGQEVLVVTLTHSAVRNFQDKISGLLKEEGQLTGQGYRVRTLHSLAHNIVSERPDLAGVGNRFFVIDEGERTRILRNAADTWLHLHPEFIDTWALADRPDASQHNKQKWVELVTNIGSAFVRRAKDLEATAECVRDRLAVLQTQFPLLEMGCEIYQDYQRGLNYRSAVDFDDLIRLALGAIRQDGNLLERLRERWPYILEDEAQDSSRLQQYILALLAGEQGNWVRVGDPNQAIYDTFTTANPRYLRNFLTEPGVQAVPMPNSGRSAKNIVKLANALINWTMVHHPVEALRGALTTPEINPTGPGDPQPNPPARKAGIYIQPPNRTEPPDEELAKIQTSLKKWLAAHPDETVAVLAPSNKYGGRLADALKKCGIEVFELLRAPANIREVAKVLMDALRSLDDPTSASKLALLYSDLYRLEQNPPPPDAPTHQAAIRLLRTCRRLEDYLYPGEGEDWLNTLAGADPGAVHSLGLFRETLQRWQQAALLPADQLALTLAQELFTTPADKRDSYDLALFLEMLANNHPEYSLSEYANELQKIVENRRKVPGHEDGDNVENADKQFGKVVVSTAHKAKGLEWDRVYLISANTYDFPSAQPNDQYQSESWFVRDRLNLQAETLSRLDALFDEDLPALYQPFGLATEQARLDYCAERLRLLFVAITRAKRELTITWNTGRNGDQRCALPLVYLHSFLQGESDETET